MDGQKAAMILQIQIAGSREAVDEEGSRMSPEYGITLYEELLFRADWLYLFPYPTFPDERWAAGTGWLLACKLR
jgi:hypothetical protein